jgi:hypothetical protein
LSVNQPKTNVVNLRIKNPLWHVAWSTKGAWPPADARGDWARLAEFYAPLVLAEKVAISQPLPSRYLPQTSKAILLSKEDLTALPGWLTELTRANGDRVAGDNPVSATAFGPTQVHVLFRCDRDRLNQVVGRLKSRLATLLLFEPRWKNEHGIWGKGFWTAEILDPAITTQVVAFIQGLSAPE